MARNNCKMSIHRASTVMDALEGRWNGMFYNVFECEILLKKCINYKLGIANHHETCPGKVERSNASDWLILFPEARVRSPGEVLQIFCKLIVRIFELISTSLTIVP